MGVKLDRVALMRTVAAKLDGREFGGNAFRFVVNEGGWSLEAWLGQWKAGEWSVWAGSAEGTEMVILKDDWTSERREVVLNAARLERIVKRYMTVLFGFPAWVETLASGLAPECEVVGEGRREDLSAIVRCRGREGGIAVMPCWATGGYKTWVDVRGVVSEECCVFFADVQHVKDHVVSMFCDSKRLRRCDEQRSFDELALSDGDEDGDVRVV